MSDYAYTNARIRAMEARLLGQDQYRILLDVMTLDALMKALKNSPYALTLEQGPGLPDSVQPSQAVARVDEALRRDLTENLHALRNLFSDRPRELLNALFFRWDVYNLKTVLRGKRAAAPVEEILTTTFPVGVLDDIAVAELARAPTIQAVANLLNTWRLPLARPIRTGLRLLEEGNTLQPLEYELDRFVYVFAFRFADGGDNDRVVRDYLRILADNTNLLTALHYPVERSALSSVEAGRYFLEGGGRFTRTHYDSVVDARDLREGLVRLASTPYGGLAETLLERETISLPLVERELDRLAIRKAASLCRPDPLGIGPAITYLERKTNEVRNLRMIVRGKALGMDAEQINEWVVV